LAALPKAAPQTYKPTRLRTQRIRWLTSPPPA